MLKKSLLGAFLVLLASCASTPPAPQTAKATSPSSSGSPAGCVNKTASRLPSRPEDCAGFGNSHSQDALKSTGQTDAANALQLLDPSVTAGH